MQASIVVPAFNSQKFLADCLDSILAQTMDDFECIVVDDGSSDGTLDVCRRYCKKDGRIKAAVQDHLGPGAARNRGLNLAKGDYVQFVDSDDLLKPNALEEELKFIEDNDLDLTLFNGEGVAVNIDPFRQMHVNRQLQMKEDYGVSSGKDFFCRLVENENFNSYIFLQMQSRRSLHCRFSRIPMDEELLYSIRSIAEAGKVGHLQKKLYVKRGWKGTILTSPLTVERGILSLAKAMLEAKEWLDKDAMPLGSRVAECASRILHSRQRELEQRTAVLSDVQRKRLEYLPPAERCLLDAALSI